MFKALQPLLQERSIHILLSANKDGKVGVYVSPVKKDDKEDAAFVTPFRCEGTADELDAELPGVLTQWLSSRAAITTSLSEALAAAEAQAKAAADEAKKKAADKNKKPTTAITTKTATPAKAVPGKASVAAPVTPSLLDAPATLGNDEDEDDEGGESAATVESTAPEAAGVITEPAPAPAAVVSSEPVTAELF